MRHGVVDPSVRPVADRGHIRKACAGAGRSGHLSRAQNCAAIRADKIAAVARCAADSLPDIHQLGVCVHADRLAVDRRKFGIFSVFQHEAAVSIELIQEILRGKACRALAGNAGDLACFAQEPYIFAAVRGAARIFADRAVGRSALRRDRSIGEAGFERAEVAVAEQAAGPGCGIGMGVGNVADAVAIGQPRGVLRLGHARNAAHVPASAGNRAVVGAAEQRAADAADHAARADAGAVCSDGGIVQAVRQAAVRVLHNADHSADAVRRVHCAEICAAQQAAARVQHGGNAARIHIGRADLGVVVAPLHNGVGGRRNDPGGAAVCLDRAVNADIPDRRGLCRNEKRCAAARRDGRHLRDLVAVAIKRAGKRVLIRADTVPPADAVVKGLVVVHKGNVRAELHGLPGESVALADELCQARKLPRRGQRELRASVAVPIGLG